MQGGESSAERSAPEEVRIGIAVVCHGDKVLVGLRPCDAPLAGYWEFPGGKCHGSEPVEACAVRECCEETGVQVAVRELIAEVRHQYQHGALRLYFFRCEPIGPSAPRPPFMWVDRRHLSTLPMPPANAAVVENLVSSQEHMG